uniref:Uncharacterized protein n=1 Tax=Glossina palpalis gambiensis TaxID=67801 RepID=A0A1B0BL22_9MUSC
CVCVLVLTLIVSYFLSAILIVLLTEGHCLAYAKDVTVDRNGICALYERTLRLDCVDDSEEEFTFYTKSRIFRCPCTSYKKALDGGGIFLQIKTCFAQMKAKISSSLENTKRGGWWEHCWGAELDVCRSSGYSTK